jgi:type II secretory pathway pseudopilin PulG
MKPRISHHKIAALTRVEVLVVVSIIAILILIFLKKTESDIRTGRLYSANITCINNLKQIGLAYKVWEGNHGDKFPMQTSVTNGGTMELANGGNAWINFAVMSKELNTPKVLICPADTDKIAATNFANGFNNSKICYFVGLNAAENYPQTLLSGDGNFEISGVPVKPGLLEFSTDAPISWTAARHKFDGNLGMADGSVQQVTSSYLRRSVQQTGLATNRLAIP